MEEIEKATMFDVFKNYLDAQVTLSEAEFARIKSLAIVKQFTKREFVLREGEVAGYTNFVTKGLVRLFQTDSHGNEYILKFAHECRWVNDRESYLSGQPAVANIEALEDSELLTWTKADFDLLLTEVPLFKELMKTLSAKNQIAAQQRLYASMSLSAEERYEQFIAGNPLIINRIPLHMIAAYLGVSRETLSRFRRQAVQK